MFFYREGDLKDSVEKRRWKTAKSNPSGKGHGNLGVERRGGKTLRREKRMVLEKGGT